MYEISFFFDNLPALHIITNYLTNAKFTTKAPMHYKKRKSGQDDEEDGHDDDSI
jgi:hypothetical protein